MKVKDVIINAIKMLGDSNFVKYLTEASNENEQYNLDKELLLLSYNQALETAVNYSPLTYQETLLSHDGLVKYSAFKYNPYKIVEVETEKAFQTYEILPTRIKTQGKITVLYVYIPTVKKYEEDFVYENSKISLNVFCYGVLSEFLIYKGRFEEATMYFDKFLNALKTIKFSKKIKKIRSRKWF